MKHHLSTRPALVCLLLALGASSAAADTPYSVAIIDRDLWLGQDSVDLSIDNGGRAKACIWIDPASGREGLDGGFDFLVCYDLSGLSFWEADRGADLHPDWEYFTWNTSVGSGCGNCPQGFVRFVGIADMIGGITPPAEAFDVSGCVVEMDFIVTSDPAFVGSSLPVGFCSLDCGDNVISSVAGDSLYFPSLGVVHGPDYDSAACISVDPPVWTSFSEFLPATILVSDWLRRGNINLNNIAYEIGDAVLFSNFFIQGDGVFSSIPLQFEAQIRASDANCDDIPTTTADLSYLINVIIGDLSSCDAGGVKSILPTEPAMTARTGPMPSLADTMLLSSTIASVGDTFVVDLYLRNEDTLRLFNVRLRYDPASIEPLTYTAGGEWIEAELLRGASTFESRAGSIPEPGVVVYSAVDFHPVLPDAFAPGAGVTLRMRWHVLPSAGSGVTTITFEDRPDLPFSYNTFSDMSATIWKLPVLTAGSVTICSCPFQCDYDDDGFLTAIDLSALIDVLFGGTIDLQDPLCPSSRGDFTGNGFADALDLAGLIDHLFAGGDPPCNPCDPVQSTCSE